MSRNLANFLRAALLASVLIVASQIPGLHASAQQPCPPGTGPAGITAGSYPPTSLTQAQRQWLFTAFGHAGTAPVGYGGEECAGSSSTGALHDSQLATWNLYHAPTYTLQYDPSRWRFGELGHFGYGLISTSDPNCDMFEPGPMGLPDDITTELIGSTQYTVVSRLSVPASAAMYYAAMGETDPNGNHPFIAVAVPAAAPQNCIANAKAVLATLTNPANPAPNQPQPSPEASLPTVQPTASAGRDQPTGYEESWLSQWIQQLDDAMQGTPPQTGIEPIDRGITGFVSILEGGTEANRFATTGDPKDAVRSFTNVGSGVLGIVGGLAVGGVLASVSLTAGWWLIFGSVALGALHELIR